MLINNIDEKKHQEFREKARAVIVDENNNLILISIENNYCLPGGDVENGESMSEAIKRELEEEIGLITDDLMYLNTYIHYHDNYAGANDIEVVSRVNKIHYFYKRINTNMLKENNPTEYELEHGMNVVKYSFDEVIKLLGPSDNDFTNALNEETLNILKYANEQGLI